MTDVPQESDVRDGSAPTPPRLVVGLGNPGERYRGTRHNVGFEVIDELLRRRAPQQPRRLECNALIVSRGDTLFVAPQTYMNRSGFTLRCLEERFGLEAQRVLVIYDDTALPLGQLRLRGKGSPGGHRGMESVIENLRTDGVPRVRCGIAAPEGPPGGGDELVRFVLEPFRDEEQDQVESMVQRAADACEAWLDSGLQRAMNDFNG
ncbi:MAG: aminoacyl-tRNA hydrolase [Acidobacteriota bacterium]